MKERITIRKIWGILYPMLMYGAIQYAVAQIFVTVLIAVKSSSGDYNSNSELMKNVSIVYNDNVMLLTLLAGLITMPILILLMHRDKRTNILAGKYKRYENVSILKFLLIIPFSAFVMLAANYLVSVIVLFMPENMASSYDSTANAIYGSSFLIQIIAAGICGPIVEELVFRGVMYNRMKTMFGMNIAAICTAVLFGVFHGNWVQAPYAIILGLVCVYLYERYKSFLAPCLLHMTANTISVLLSELSKTLVVEETETVTITMQEQLIALIQIIAFTGIIAYALSRIINKLVNPKEIENEIIDSSDSVL